MEARRAETRRCLTGVFTERLRNARECAQLLRRRRLSSVILVSDRTHLLRARLLFRLAGIEIAAGAGVRAPSLIWEIGAALREAAALPRSLIRAAWQFRSPGGRPSP